MSYLAYDFQATAKSTADVLPVTIYDKGSGTFVKDASASSATSNTVKVAVGDNLMVAVFNNSAEGSGFYPELNPYAVNGDMFNPLDFVVEGEQPKIEIHAHKITTSLRVRAKDRDDNFGANITVSASGRNNYKYIEVENNGSNSAYNLGGFYQDLVTGTNITDITIGSTVTKKIDADNPNPDSGACIYRTDVSIKRQQDKDDYVWEFDEDCSVGNGYQPIWLEAGDYVQTGSWNFEVDSDGCPTGAGLGEPISQIYAFDKSLVKSTLATKLLGVENKAGVFEDDASSASDIAGGDFQMTFSTSYDAGAMYCKS